MNIETFRQDAALAAVKACGLNLDANETAIFLQALEHVKVEIVETEYPERRSKEFIPVASGVDRGAETFVWYRYDKIGLAKMMANYDNALPNVTEFGTKQTSPIEDAGVAYSYSVQDLEKAAKANHPLSPRLGRIAREAMEYLFDLVFAHGYSAAQIPGLLTASGVPVVTAGLNGDWDGAATAAEIYADLMTMAFTVWTQSKQLHKPNAMLLGTTLYKAAFSKPFSTLNGESVAAVFLKSQDMIKSIDSWTELDLADAQGDGERALVYTKSPQNLEGILPIEFESLAPQQDNLNFKVPCRGRIGGCVVYRPLSMAFFDGLND